jgi:hypothetical protein
VQVRSTPPPRFRGIVRTSSNSRASVFQTDDAGAIPAVRSTSRFSEEDRGLQHRARGFDSLSALQREMAAPPWLKGEATDFYSVSCKFESCRRYSIRRRSSVAEQWPVRPTRAGSTPAASAVLSLPSWRTPRAALRKPLPRFDSWRKDHVPVV